jgi:hypothetical protein
MKRLGPNFAIRVGGQKVSARMEMAMDKSVSGEEVLSLVRRFESLHLPLAPSHRSM